MPKILIKCSTCSKQFYEYLCNRQSDNKYCSKDCYSVGAKRIRGKLASGYIHGMSHTHFHNKWVSMLQRCTDKNHHKYPRYGGRGIKICKKWYSFSGFYNDMYSSYLIHLDKFGKKETTLERIDNEGNYSKENCRWATIKEQARNRSNRVEITLNGETHSVKEWSEIIGISNASLWVRLFKKKLPIEIALKK